MKNINLSTIKGIDIDSSTVNVRNMSRHYDDIMASSRKPLIIKLSKSIIEMPCWGCGEQIRKDDLIGISKYYKLAYCHKCTKKSLTKRKNNSQFLNELNRWTNSEEFKNEMMLRAIEGYDK